MLPTPLVLSLPIADRQAACTFYRATLEIEPVGRPADDGVPEPLQFPVNDGLVIMLIPTGGFGWVIGDRAVASNGTNECVVGLSAESDDDVDALIERARTAGATVVTEPGPQAWGYAGTFADPDGHLWMATSAPWPP